eukprot:gene13118-14400_t
MSTLKNFSTQYSKINEQVAMNLTLPNKSMALENKSQFPQRHDVIKRTFLTRKLKPLHSKEVDDGEEEQWLFPDRLSDPSFGVKGNSTEKSLTRAYRRIASSSLFVTPSNQNATLNELASEQRRFGKKNYILVEENRLRQLIKLDEALQKEEAKLGQQCSIIAQDYQLPARIPVPATRYAIHHLCEEQMARARSEIMTLQQEWVKFSRQNHYHKPHLFIKNSYVDSAPHAQKALKLRLVKEATSTWLLRKERDTMAYEDDLSFLTCLYYDALQRQRDYERYFILATRYGPFEEEEFYKDSFPGKRYYKKVTVAAYKLQLLWDRYWAVTKLRRYRSARMIQKHWRRMHIYKKLHPIIKLRMKIGKKTYYIFCFARWKEYNELCRRIRDALTYQMSNSTSLCFNAWKGFIKKQRNDRERQLESFGKKFRNLAIYTCYRHWQVYTRENKRLKIRLRRLFAFPQFDIWVEYTKWSKHLKKVNQSAVCIQCLGRKWKAKKYYKKRVEARERVFNFSLMLVARNIVRRYREKIIEKEYEQWKPEELIRRQQRASEGERQRLQRKQLFIQEKERNILKELKKHLQSSDGMIQLKAMVEEHLLTSARQPKKNTNTPASNTVGGLGASSKSTFTTNGDAMMSEMPSLSLPLDSISRQTSNANLLITDRSSLPPLTSQDSNVSSVFSPELQGHEDKAPHGLLSWIPFLGSNSTQRQQYHKQLDLMVKKLKKSCTKYMKLLEGHNYEVKYSSSYRCYHPHCHQMNFLNEEQYHRHIYTSDIYPHKIEKEIQLPEQKKWIEKTLKECKEQIIDYHQRQEREKEKEREKTNTDSSSPSPSAKPQALTTSHRSQSLLTLMSLELPKDVNEEDQQSQMMDDYQIEVLEERYPLLMKYAYHRNSTHFHQLLKHVKGIESFRHYYLHEYGLGKIINAFDCYLAIQEWKKCTTVQPQYYTKAVSIYEMYLQEDAVRALEIHSLPNYQHYASALQGMTTKLAMVKDEDYQGFPGFYHPTLKKLTTFQIIFGVQASSYTHWTAEKLLLPSIFQELEIVLFQQLYHQFRFDRGFLLSLDYYQYLTSIEKDAKQREEQLYQDYKQYRLNIIGNWAISFKQYENMISQKADLVLEQVIKNQIEEIYRPVEKRSVRERTTEKRNEEQSLYEENMLKIDEAIHYTADDCADFVFDYYVKALIKAMWEVPEYRKGMLQYSGYAKFKLKKKNDVMANYELMMSNKEKVQESKEWFNQFFNSTSHREKSLLPKDAASSWKKQSLKYTSLEEAKDSHHLSMTMIQKRIRGLLGRKQAKKEFAKTFKKIYDPSSQQHYYYNTVTHESSWTAPNLFKKLYGKAVW